MAQNEKAAAETRELLERYAKEGGEALEARLVELNLGLAASVAMRFRGRGADQEDLVQIGSIGLLKAVRSFDPARGFAFSTYAVPLIIGEIRRFLRDDGALKVGRGMKRTGALLMKEREAYMAEHGEEIISSADSVVVEIDMELEILERVFDLSEKYGKKVFAVVSNMSIAMERRNFLRRTCCLVCNEQEAAMLFSENYDGCTVEELIQAVGDDIQKAGIPCMVVTLGKRGSIYVSAGGENGYCPSLDV